MALWIEAVVKKYHNSLGILESSQFHLLSTVSIFASYPTNTQGRKLQHYRLLQYKNCWVNIVYLLLFFFSVREDWLRNELLEIAGLNCSCSSRALNKETLMPIICIRFLYSMRICIESCESVVCERAVVR